MELYPIIEPFVNYTKNKLAWHKKVASDLTIFAKNKARRMLATGDEDAAEKAKDTKKAGKKDKVDGADGAVVTEGKEKLTTGYPDPLFEKDEDVQNGGFMVYLFCKYNKIGHSNL